MTAEITRLDSLNALSQSPLAGATDEDEGDASASLHPDLWRAMVSETPGTRWYMDLENFQIIRVMCDDRPGSPVSDDPDRYVEVPTLATDRQRDHARAVLAEQVGADQASFLTGDEPWLRHFHEHASPELRQVLSDARRAWVIGEVRAWLRDHDIAEYRFVRSNRPAGRDPRSGRLTRARVHQLRDALHRAIDRMTERELEALPIPARLLIED